MSYGEISSSRLLSGRESFRACKKWYIGGFEVSLSMDDSLGYGRGEIIRSDIRIYKTLSEERRRDVTKEAFPEEFAEGDDGEVIDDSEGVNLCRAMEWCRRQ